MSGTGNRFIEAGYKDPKPLIVIDGKPVIEHVCDLFPGETKFTFICNSKHLAETDMRKILLKLKPDANVVEIPNHKKGPVFAVNFIENLIDNDEEVIVNYCDFGTYWDYRDFLNHTRSRSADGAVVAYRGFHPHMMGSTNYAFMRESHQWMLEIKEKEPFTNNRMNEYASNGTYYFKKGSYVKKYFNELIERDINLKGEYYVSLIYNLLVEDGLKVSIYEIQHMLQWGTPQDVEEYKNWSKYFRALIAEKDKLETVPGSLTLIPMAGRGSRFANEGYVDPKPLIEVSGKPMIVQAANSLPRSQSHIFVALQDHLDRYPLQKALTSEFPDCKIVPLNEVTEGQAITCGFGLKGVDEDLSLLIAASDNGIIYNREKYQDLINDPNVDAIIFTFRHHVSSRNNPQMYGWVKTSGNDVEGVSVKVPVSKDPFNDHAIVGTFYFRKVKFFNEALENLVKKNIRVNNEYYVDSMMGILVDLGYKVKVFEVDDYICWGTPDDYRTYVYWQSFFHKTCWHPYFLEKDMHANRAKISMMNEAFIRFEQEFR